MNRSIRVTVSVVLGTALLAGCATKSQLRRGLDEQRAALEADRADRIAGEERLAGDIGALRTELAGLQDDFGAKIAALEEGLQVAMPVLFAFDETEIRSEDYEVLDRFVRVVQRFYPHAYVTIQGFADPAGPQSYNRRLSQRRAEEVQAYLVSKGLSEAQLRPVGLGATRPVVPGAAGDRDGAELNRRVVFVVEGAAPVGLATATR
jgi:outer membrane protein OmpA-like peptidoglycan-associated protein